MDRPWYERLRPSPTDPAVQPPTAVGRPVVGEASAKSHRSCRPTTNGGGSTRRTRGFGQVPPILTNGGGSPVVREASAKSHRPCRPTTNGGGSTRRTGGFGQVSPILPSNHQRRWIDPSYGRLRPSLTDPAVQPPTAVDRPVVREASAKSHRSSPTVVDRPSYERLRPSPTDPAVQPPTAVDRPVVREASAKSHRSCRPTTNGGGSTRRTGGFGQVSPILPSNHQRRWIDPSYERLRPSLTDPAVQPPTAVDRPVVREASAKSHRSCRPTTNGGGSTRRTGGFGQVSPILPSNHQRRWIDPSYGRLRPSLTDPAVQPPTAVDRPVVREASAKSHRSCRPTTNGGGSTRRTRGFGQVSPILPSNHQRRWIDPSYGRLRPSLTDPAVQPPTAVDRPVVREASAKSHRSCRPTTNGDRSTRRTRGFGQVPPILTNGGGSPVVREASAKSHRSCRPATNGGGSTRRTGGFGQVSPILPSNHQRRWIDPSYERLRPSLTDPAVQPPTAVDRPVVREASAKSHRSCRPTTNGGGSTRRTGGFGQVSPILPSNHQRRWIDPSYERLRPSLTDPAVQPPTAVDRPVVREASAKSHRSCRPTTNGGGSTRRTRGFGQVSPILPSNHQRR